MLGSSNQIKPWLDVAYRRRYWILVPALLGLVGGLVALTQMPKIYMAQTTIVWRQQTIPPGYVPQTVSTGVLDRLATLSVAMTSRPWLVPIARDFKLIGPEAKENEIAMAVGRLRMMVRPEIDTMRPPRFFKISVQHGDGDLAAKIANNLASKVVNQNTSIRLKEAEDALATAQKFRADVQAELDRQQNQLARYKSDKLWQLPDQLGPNMQLLNGAQTRITSIDNDIRSLNDRINILKMTPNTVLPAGSIAAPMDPAVVRYEQLKRELADLELKYTDMNPDVRAKRVELDAWVRLYPQVVAPPAAPSTGTDDTPKGLSPNELQIVQAQAQIKQLEAARRDAEAQLGVLQGRINQAPTRAQEMEGLTRGLDPLQQQYNVWVQRETDAQRSLALEKAKQGEQFEIQEVAYPPLVPYSPVPIQVILAGLGIGLALGVGLSFLLEFLDNSVRTEEEFATSFPELPLLAAIPDLDRTARSRKRKSSRRRAAAAVVFLLALGGLTTLTSLSGSLPFLR